MTFIELLCAFGLGIPIGALGGIVVGFAWYERKCGLWTDGTGKRTAAIRGELDDVMDRCPDLKKLSDVAPKRDFHVREIVELPENSAVIYHFSHRSP
jgi:hypothetical protein